MSRTLTRHQLTCSVCDSDFTANGFGGVVIVARQTANAPVCPNCITSVVLSSPCGTKLDTGDGIVLIVNHRHAVGDDGTPEFVTLTEDGRFYSEDGWHADPEDKCVYVERWTAKGREFHGFIDSVSRKLVQAG